MAEKEKDVLDQVADDLKKGIAPEVGPGGEVSRGRKPEDVPPGPPEGRGKPDDRPRPKLPRTSCPQPL